MSRFARDREVWFVEDAVRDADLLVPVLDRQRHGNVTVVTPRLPDFPGDPAPQLRRLIDALIRDEGIAAPICWYYTPMMLEWSRHLASSAVVYDCMDELANFRFAPPELHRLETELFSRADVVFTGGHSLFEAKRDRHPHVHAFPSRVDIAHFGQARAARESYHVQPCLGFCGVIDERMDLELLRAVAEAKPDWRVAVIGPVVKIDPAELPRRDNIEYLGARRYEELPGEMATWDVALLPFALNEATRFISPTKTPEYLAAGLPVVSTPVHDVAYAYGDLEGVHIAATADEFVAACERALVQRRSDAGWLAEVDVRLATQSWEDTCARMTRLMAKAASRRRGVARRSVRPHVFDTLIVGAGFAGSVLAERLSAGSKQSVLLIDQRPHIAGNAYDCYDAQGILIHQYGPHIFHTNAERVLAYLSRFTAWRPYQHRVLADLNGDLVPIPINRTTLNRVYGLALRTDEEAREFLAAAAEPVAAVRTSEDSVVSAVGRDLYEKFFRGYTRKQWGVDPSQLDASVTSRIPTRCDTNDRYFDDRFQCMPLHGYTAMFERMLDHPGITRELGVSYADIRSSVRVRRVIYTGPIDEFFDYRFGALPYRSLRFEHRALPVEQFQPVAVVNYPDESVPYTRITEYKHLTGQRHRHTSVTYEFPNDRGDPYYPVPRAENRELLRRYEQLAAARRDVTFVGRLGTYKYYNMDQVVAQALATWTRMMPVAEQSTRTVPETELRAAV